MSSSRRPLLRVAVAVGGAVMLGGTAVGPAYADHGDGDDAFSNAGSPDYGPGHDRRTSKSDHSSDERDDHRSAGASDADSNVVNGDARDRRREINPAKRKNEGVYGLDDDPAQIAEDNLDGTTDAPGVYKHGIGTVEVPRVDAR